MTMEKTQLGRSVLNVMRFVAWIVLIVGTGLLMESCSSISVTRVKGDGLEQKFKIQAKLNHFLLHEVITGNIRMVRYAIKEGADVNAKNNHGVTVLMVASGLGRSDIVQLLLKAGANVNATTDKGITALHIAKVRNHPEIVSLIKHAPQFQGQPKGMDTYERVKARAMEAIRKGPPFPSLPESYRREMVMGLQAIRDARTSAGYNRASDHFLNASKLAPWASKPYEALGHIAETLKNYEEAADYFKLSLLVNPKSPDIRTIQDHVYELEEKAKER